MPLKYSIYIKFLTGLGHFANNEARSRKPGITRKAQLARGFLGKNANLFLRPSVYFARSRVIAQRPQPTGFPPEDAIPGV